MNRSIRSFALVALVFAIGAVSPVQGQTITALHTFTGGRDGANPMAGLTTDARGNLYGTAAEGGSGYGTVFKLGRQGSGWVFIPLHAFAGPPSDGANPMARVVFGPNQTLYGTTLHGGGPCTNGGCGTVFNLQPPPTACVTALCPWRETVLLSFDGNGGSLPYSEVTFDSAGNMFGTTQYGDELQAGGGPCEPLDCGVVYELSPSNGGWIESTPYGFTDGNFGQPGGFPVAGVTFDSAGNLYGITGGYFQSGNIYKLTPPGDASPWTYHDLYDFESGGGALANMILDPSGTFYGDTAGLAPGYGDQPGSVFSFAPNGQGGWTFTSLHTFPTLGGGPSAQLLEDSAGNLYGTTVTGGINPNGTCVTAGCGTIFELSPSGGSWNFTVLYEFTGGADGAAPYSNLIMDEGGNLYGTASAGGSSNCTGGCGVVFKFTP
jgi:uncharacterized repeat protein (TIGR03803 family)